MIPHGTRLVDIPKYLQESQRGVFGSGLSSYYRDGYWYIWPSYDTTRFTKEEIRLTIINVPQTRFPGMERTFKYDGNNNRIISLVCLLLSFCCPPWLMYYINTFSMLSIYRFRQHLSQSDG